MINWGIIGLGGIAARFCESLANFDDARFYAGGSYTEKKRQMFMEQYHPGENAYFNRAAIPRTLVYKLTVEGMTAKRKELRR